MIKSKLLNGIIKHAPLILMINGGALTIATVIFAIRGTKKAEKEIDSIEFGVSEPIPKKEKAKIYAKNHIPTMITGAAALGSFAGSYVCFNKKNAELNTLLASQMETVSATNSVVSAVLTDEQKKEITKKLSKKELNDKQQSVEPSGDFYWCVDLTSGGEFWTNKADVQSAWALVVANAAQDQFVSINEFHGEIHGRRFPSILPDVHDHFGFSASHAYSSVSFRPCEASNGSPAWGFYYDYISEDSAMSF